MALVVFQRRCASSHANAACFLRSGACAGDIDNFCAKVEPGEQRLSACLSTQQDEEAKGNNEGVHIPTVPQTVRYHAAYLHGFEGMHAPMLCWAMLQARP